MIKKGLCIGFLVLISLYSSLAQEFTGYWEGILDIQTTKLRLGFRIKETADGIYQATMDSPDQGTKGIPIPSTMVNQNRIVMRLPNALIEYTGLLNEEDQIIGTFIQEGQSFPLSLSKKIVRKEVKRFQEPTKPYPYKEEEITFRNEEEGIILSGTLTIPKGEGVYPAVILITGSGPQNRNEELAGHKPFLVLADYLTRKGIAVLRYDDRGVGASKGNFKEATTLDFASDVTSALLYLNNRKDIHNSQIGLIGHSEGGVIAPLVASKTKDVRFIVLLAGTGVTGEQILLSQLKKFKEVSGLKKEEQQKILKIHSEIYALINTSQNLNSLKNELRLYLDIKWKDYPNAQKSGMNKKDFINLQMSQISTPWMHFFISHDPTLALSKVKCPVLALNGEKDWQVNYEINLKAIEMALAQGGNTQFSIKSFPGLNHLFQECQTGSIVEYAQIEQTLSPLVLKEISRWVLSTLKSESK